MTAVLSSRQWSAVVSAVLCLSYVLSCFSHDLFVGLTLIPTEVFVTNNRVWTFVTSSFVEGNVIRLVTNCCLIFIITSPEEVKFDQQFAIYMSSNILASTIGAFMWLMIRFFGTDSQTFMIGSCYGSGGVVMLLAMFTRRLVGDRPVLPQVPLITFHYLPTLLISVLTTLKILRFNSLTADINFVYFTFFSSWTYLHFLYKIEGEESTSSFTFIGMFPEALHPVVLPLSIATYNFFSMLGIFPKLELDRRGLQHHLRYHESKAPSSNGSGEGVSSVSVSPSPGSNSGEDLIAERRRAKAIKLLDAKMAELSKEPEGWEDLKEDGADKSKV